MSALRKLALPTMLLAPGATAFAEGVSQRALEVFRVPGLDLPITNAMITSWVVTLLLIFLVRWAVGRPRLVPTRGQAVVEGLLQSLREMFEPIVGKRAMPATFPLLICFFVFILIHNWSGLFPFVGTVGTELIDRNTHAHVGFIPWIRPHTSDLNGTIALALTSFGAWLIICIKYAGPKLIMHDLFGNKASKKELPEAMYWALSLVFLIVGLIEVVSILIRPITLSVRLYGNVFGGESLLHNTSFIPVFYFLEILVGLVQAFVFTLLTSVYIGLICNHGDDHGEAHGEHGHGQVEEGAH